MPIKGRKKGVVYEQRLAQTFREKGWAECVTSRSESKNLDDKGIDLCFTNPFTVQAKAVERFGKHHEILKAMGQAVPDMIPVIFHKRNNKGTTVTMTEEDFWRLITHYAQLPIRIESSGFTTGKESNTET